MSDKKPNTSSNIFANALSTTPKYVGEPGSVSAGMHNNLTCGHCGAAREKNDDGPLVCRYCSKPLQSKK
jgi:hypothetical protein